MTDEKTGSAPDDRFGVTDEAMRAAIEAHRGIIRAGLYVPTRSEVLTMPIGWVADVLIDWIWESPTQLIPTDQQVEAVVTTLEAREDAASAEVRRLINELRAV